jgi:tetratricopeptide (TPR) repeat protein
MDTRALACLLLVAIACGRSVASYETRSVELVDAGRLPEALVVLDRAIAAWPDRAELHFRRANVLTRLGREDEAQAAYDRYVELRPFADAIPYLGNSRDEP